MTQSLLLDAFMGEQMGEPSLYGWSDKQILGNVLATLKYF